MLFIHPSILSILSISSILVILSFLPHYLLHCFILYLSRLVLTVRFYSRPEKSTCPNRTVLEIYPGKIPLKAGWCFYEKIQSSESQPFLEEWFLRFLRFSPDFFELIIFAFCSFTKTTCTFLTTFLLLLC